MYKIFIDISGSIGGHIRKAFSPIFNVHKLSFLKISIRQKS